VRDLEDPLRLGDSAPPRQGAGREQDAALRVSMRRQKSCLQGSGGSRRMPVGTCFRIAGCINGNTVELPLLAMQPLHTVILVHWITSYKEKSFQPSRVYGPPPEFFSLRRHAGLIALPSQVMSGRSSRPQWRWCVGWFSPGPVAWPCRDGFIIDTFARIARADAGFRIVLGKMERRYRGNCLVA